MFQTLELFNIFNKYRIIYEAKEEAYIVQKLYLFIDIEGKDCVDSIELNWKLVMLFEIENEAVDFFRKLVNNEISEEGQKIIMI